MHFQEVRTLEATDHLPIKCLEIGNSIKSINHLGLVFSELIPFNECWLGARHQFCIDCRIGQWSKWLATIGPSKLEFWLQRKLPHYVWCFFRKKVIHDMMWIVQLHCDIDDHYVWHLWHWHLTKHMVACHVIASMTLSRQTVSITLEYSHFQSGAAVIFALMARMASKKTHPPTVIFLHGRTMWDIEFCNLLVYKWQMIGLKEENISSKTSNTEKLAIFFNQCYQLLY